LHSQVETRHEHPPCLIAMAIAPSSNAPCDPYELSGRVAGMNKPPHAINWVLTLGGARIVSGRTRF
jgi:hypothetical protein